MFWHHGRSRQPFIDRSPGRIVPVRPDARHSGRIAVASVSCLAIAIGLALGVATSGGSGSRITISLEGPPGPLAVAASGPPAAASSMPLDGAVAIAGRGLAGGVGRGASPLGAGGPDPQVRGATPILVPEIVRFRPRLGWTDVAPAANLSVRFTTAMEHWSTERAFSATVVGGEPIVGTFAWAELDTVLVLDPSKAMQRGAQVRLEVAPGALSSEGTPLNTGSSATFRVAPKPSPTSAQASGWRWPLLGPITQSFGETATMYGFHQGIDIDGDTGDPVRAARAGRVVVAGHYDACGGLEVHIDHGGGIVSWYRHLSRVDVSASDLVTSGAVIGRLGNTGCSLGSHLHFAIRKDTAFVDPLPYLPPR